MSKKTEPKTKEVKEEIPDVDISEAQVALEEAVMELIHNEPFYANLTLNMRREFTLKVPTLAVNVTDEVNLFINPYFFCNHTVAERASFIKHECLHVVNNHFVRFRDLEPQIYDNPEERKMIDRLQDMQNASTLNQAADYAINEYIPTLPQVVFAFDKNGKIEKIPTHLPDGTKNPDPNAGKAAEGHLLFVKDLAKKIPSIIGQQNLEYYYEFLKQQQEKDNKNGKGQGQGNGQGMVLDDHSMWHESDATEDQISDKVKDVVNKAVEETGERAMGTMHHGILQSIESLNHVPRDWRGDLQKFVARTAEIVIEQSRKRRNRRYGIMFAGNIIYPKLHLALLSDTSGSVQEEEATQFGAEMGRIYKMDVKITVIEHDSQVNQIYEFDPKKPVKIVGRGGTSFKEAYEKAALLDIDGIMHFTDGECWDEQIKRPKVPVLACIYGNRDTYPYKWASKTKIEIRKRVRR
jgi:predicted metal-dependent peptidase